MPLQFRPGPAPDTHDAYSGELLIGRVLKSPDGGWFWSLSALARPPQGRADTLDAAKRDMSREWEEWKRYAGLR